MDNIQALLPKLIASLSLITISVAVLSAPPERTDAETTNGLRIATYGAGCRFAEAAQSPKIGQAIITFSHPSIIFNIHIAALSSTPYTPEGYVLDAQAGESYLYVSHNGTAFNLNGNSFTFLAGPGASEQAILRRLVLHLRDREKAPIVLTPCFSHGWNGVYPR